MKNSFITFAAAVGLAASSLTLMAGGSIPNQQSLNGVPIIHGMFIGDLPANIPTNDAPLGLVSNPLTFGASYTNPAARGFIEASLVVTNSGTGYITNYTTAKSYPIGAINTTGTNYETVTIRVGPSEVVGIVTNQVGAFSLIGSEWRN